MEGDGKERDEKKGEQRGFPGRGKKKRKENSSVRNCTLIKAVSSEIPFFEGSRLLNKLFRVKSLFALPWIIHGFVSSWYLHSREDSCGWDTI